MLENDTKIFDNQADHSAKLDILIGKVDDLARRLPPSTVVQPVEEIKLEIKNCTKETDNGVSQYLMGRFNEKISGKPFNKTGEYPDDVEEKLTDAVSKTFDDLSNQGRQLVEVKNKCLLLIIVCDTLSVYTKLIRDCLNGTIVDHFQDLLTAIRSINGCENVIFESVISEDKITETIVQLVNTLDTIVPKEDHKSPTELFKRDQTRQNESGDSGADSIQSQQDSPFNIGTMQSTYEKGCDEVTYGSGAIDICAHCASEDKLQPGLYYCFQCGSFGRYMCGDCNIKHRKYAHEVQSISDAAQQKEQNIYSFERGCDASQDDSGATDICAHCASDSNIQPAFYFCFHCGLFGRYMCENCNKQHKKFATAHEVRKLSKEAPQKREIRRIQPTPRQRPLPAVRTKTKVDMPQLVTKPVETGKIKFSGRTDNAVDKQATTPSKTENVMSSYSVKELTTMFELQMKQGTSPNKQRNISNITETRKLDSNVELVEQHTMKMKIQAAEKETDFVNRREMTTIQPTPRQRPVPAVRTKTKVEMPQLVTKSVETGKIIKFTGRIGNAVDNKATTPATTENERSSYSTNELKTTPVLQRDQRNSPNEQNKILNMSEIRKPDSNVENVEPLQQAVEIQIQAAEKNRRWKEIPVIQPTPIQRPVSAVRTKTKVDMKQLVKKSVETGESIRVSGRTGNAVGSQATTPCKREKVMSSYSAKDLKTMPVAQRVQGLSPYKQRNISNVTETRKLDSNVEKQQVMKMKIQATEKDSDLVEMRKSPMIPSKPRKRPVAVMWTESMVDMMIRDSGRTDNAVDSQPTTPFTTEKERSSYSVKDLKTMPVVQRDQVIPPYKQWNNSNITETRKHDSNVEKVEQHVMKMKIQAVEKETDIVNRSMVSGGSYFMVAAIDIGTTSSGYAFSSREMFNVDPSWIQTYYWNNGISTKTLTCVLFDKNKKFHSFGVDAEDNYSTLTLVGEHRDYYFFRRFKRTLFDNMQPKRKLMLEDETGKRMDAMDVFSACIKFLREHLMDELHKRLPDTKDNDIRWVLTLPGFCNDASKEFIRESAQKAGIHKETLLIATEPEAAIMLARNLPVKCSTVPDGGLKPFPAKSKYLVFDAGYTIKITIYEVKDNRDVRELYETSDVNLGSTTVDQAFRDFLAAIVGNDVMDIFEHCNKMDYIDLFREFDIKKRNVGNDMKQKITLKTPVTLCETFENAKGITINDHLKTKPEYNDKVYWYWYVDKLRIDPNIVKGLFQETFDTVARHLKSLFSKPEAKDVQNILMVGAFSESPLLQDFIIKTFPNMRIIIPQDASMSVLKGAVILGHVW